MNFLKILHTLPYLKQIKNSAESCFNSRCLYFHLLSLAQVTCTLCSCDIDKDSSRDHYLSQHRCEVIWNRTHSLQKVSKSPQVT